MQTPLDVLIRERLARFLAGEISLEEFRRWQVPNTWNVHQTGNAIAEELADEIEWRLAEYSHGDWSDEQLHELLRPLLAPDWQPQPENLPQPRSA